LLQLTRSTHPSLGQPVGLFAAADPTLHLVDAFRGFGLGQARVEGIGRTRFLG
jgi:hypothetical protein